MIKFILMSKEQGQNFNFNFNLKMLITIDYV